MLQARDLAARRGDTILFEHLGFTLARGTALMVSGPNGSGKTTLLRIAAGLSPPFAGTLALLGVAVGPFAASLRAAVVYIGHAVALKDEMSAEENLASLARLLGAGASEKETGDALARVGLVAQRELPARVLSQGQRRRLALARLCLVERALWILDEPGTALDDEGAAVLQRLLADHLVAGGAALVATHQPLDLPPGATSSLRLDARAML